ncbi:hypothetical protein PBI_GAIA_77 [Mycobacterium phage Gaia]|uniref:Uncharacterized protein n=1 Tax=Mycobacterium phage Gaia TaxID=1486472 RepID=A0A068F4M1_9CAUD|nr:hypothetical protein VC46_gp156 [Mycobacterium phage Gaia]AID58896.1 hypothetical protein PBI_GAIA_77 [Mycobacterium phage Gaia]AYR00015.1 hypothetical protein PBI_NEBKISS_76 [Mycobacterium phage Nebkiss]
MTEVRIRHEDDASSAFLADVPVGEVGDVIRSLADWGVELRTTEDCVDWRGKSLSGSFVYDQVRDSAYFEIVLSDE